MAQRPVFIPTPDSGDRLVDVRTFVFEWHPGFASTQKQKNVEALHAAAAADGLESLLEVSSKSIEATGVALSAFNLHTSHSEFGTISVESAFQGSKVFERGGPFKDLYNQPPAAAKKNVRLKSAGSLIGFEWDGGTWPLEPKTAFYDWLYLRALVQLDDDSTEQLSKYDGFTDIEFNPKKSINCQAKACALYVSLTKRGWDFGLLDDPDHYLQELRGLSRPDQPSFFDGDSAAP